MDTQRFSRLNLRHVKTPAFIIDTGLIKKNLSTLNTVKERTNCKILLALKGFAMYSLFPIMRETLDGVCASGPYEARLGREEFQKEVHTFAPAFSEKDFKEIKKYSDYIVFNSFSQLEKYKKQIPSKVKCGLRINPEYSEIKTDLYNPCSKNSRLGITADKFSETPPDIITGLHFHALCEQTADVLERVLVVVEKKFGRYLSQMEWVNFGGGHHITRDDYDINALCKLINDFKKKYDVNVILEPGEAVALNAGILVATVLDVIDNGKKIAILDTSAETHMPDVLSMPYRPEVISAGLPGEKKYSYLLGGLTCLAGDVIGEYSFDEPLRIGEKVIFLDMAHYSMVKTTMFNGIKHPSIMSIGSKAKTPVLIKEFSFCDYKARLS